MKDVGCWRKRNVEKGNDPVVGDETARDDGRSRESVEPASEWCLGSRKGRGHGVGDQTACRLVRLPVSFLQREISSDRSQETKKSDGLPGVQRSSTGLCSAVATSVESSSRRRAELPEAQAARTSLTSCTFERRILVTHSAYRALALWRGHAGGGSMLAEDDESVSRKGSTAASLQVMKSNITEHGEKSCHHVSA